MYEHISGLELADRGDISDELEINVLIGSDHYWRIVTGIVSRGTHGPIAIETRLGRVLSGPIGETSQDGMTANLIAACFTHTLKIEAFTVEENLETELRKFWELEALGILKDEQSVYEKFVQQISFKDGRYEVQLPWKESHSLLPDN